MKIAVTSQIKLPVNLYGGSERVIWDLCRELNALGKVRLMLITQKEMQSLLDQVNDHFKGTFQRLKVLEDQLNQLETKVEELSNASKERPKTSASRSKRVQQTKADA